ncbi:hypothetical protein P3S68_023750 [Capsicum galapagoense]
MAKISLLLIALFALTTAMEQNLFPSKWLGLTCFRKCQSANDCTRDCSVCCECWSSPFDSRNYFCDKRGANGESYVASLLLKAKLIKQQDIIPSHQLV